MCIMQQYFLFHISTLLEYVPTTALERLPHQPHPIRKPCVCSMEIDLRAFRTLNLHHYRIKTPMRYRLHYLPLLLGGMREFNRWFVRTFPYLQFSFPQKVRQSPLLLSKIPVIRSNFGSEDVALNFR